jgi:hypothetical protein
MNKFNRGVLIVRRFVFKILTNGLAHEMVKVNIVVLFI